MHRTRRRQIYSQGLLQAFNFQDPYLKAAFGLIGMDVEVVAVEGVAFGPKAAQKALMPGCPSYPRSSRLLRELVGSSGVSCRVIDFRAASPPKLPCYS
jgi:hypothetical protein